MAYGSQSSNQITLATQIHQDIDSERPRLAEQQKVTSVLKCIFDKLNMTMHVLEMPWARAKRELRTGKVDGLFLTSENNISLGQPTNPIYLEKWHAYSSKPVKALGDSPRLGVIRGSDEQQWLQSHGVDFFMEAVSYSQLIKQLYADRVQAFIADSKTLEPDRFGNTDSDKLYSTFLRYAAKTLTFSKHYVAANPGLVHRFNASISACNTEVTQLSALERNKILDYVKTTVLPQFDSKMLEKISEKLVTTQPVQALITSEDEEWQKAFAEGKQTDTAKRILTNQISLRLREVKKNNPVIGEIMLTNSDGLLIAASDYTSDYWQGDEQKIISLEGADYSLSDIQYDESTRKFIAHFTCRLTKSIRDNDSGNAAILIVGVLLEDLLIESFLF